MTSFLAPDAVYRGSRQLESPTRQPVPECVPFVEQEPRVIHFLGHLLYYPERVRAVKDGAECIPLIERMTFDAERAKRTEYQYAWADVEQKHSGARWERLCRRWATKHRARV